MDSEVQRAARAGRTRTLRGMLTLYPADGPAAIVLAPGAGAGARSPFMVQAAGGLAARGLAAATFDFPYMAAGRGVPDKPAVLEAAWRDAILEARDRLPGRRLFAGGKSMGGRIASQVAAADDAGAGLAGLVFFGYPLHPPGRPAQLRDAHLPAIGAPMLFLQGSRDAFGTAEEIRRLLPRLVQATVHEIEGADHSFRIAGRGAPTLDVVLGAALDIVRDWTVRVQ